MPAQLKVLDCVDGIGAESKRPLRQEYGKRTLFVSLKEETPESLRYPESRGSASDSVALEELASEDGATQEESRSEDMILKETDKSMAKGWIETVACKNAEEVRLGYIGLGLRDQLEVPEADRLLEVVGRIEG